jgi:hypothetical protein
MNCRQVGNDPRVVFLANVELRVGAERQRGHALVTLRLKPTKYLEIVSSSRRFMTFLVGPVRAGLMNGQRTNAEPHDRSEHYSSMKCDRRQRSYLESVQIVRCPDRLEVSDGVRRRRSHDCPEGHR